MTSPKRTWVLDKTVMTGYVIAALMLVVLFVILVSSARRYLRSTDWRQHSLEVLDKLDDITIDLLETGAAYRTFVLNTGNRIFLHPENEANLDSNVSRLILLTKDNPVQQKYIDMLTMHFAALKINLKNIRQNSNFKHLSLYRIRILIARIANASDAIKNDIGKLKAEEYKLLKARELQERRNFLWMSSLAMLSIVLIFLFLFTILYHTVKQIKRNNALNRALNGKNAELRKYNEEVLNARRELEQFTYFITHDLKEPLRMVSSFTNLLIRKMDTSEPDTAEYSGYIKEGINRMHNMVNDIMIFSKIGKTSEQKQAVDLNKTVAKVLLYLNQAISEKGAHVRTTQLPVVLALATEMTELFQNLISNALKFSRPDLKPEISIESQPPEDGMYTICVSDNGIGIDPKDRERVFAIFQRLHSRTTYEGSGIGLAYCKKIVEQHGGRIWVDSRPGGGSSFCFTLPGIETKTD